MTPSFFHVRPLLACVCCALVMAGCEQDKAEEPAPESDELSAQEEADASRAKRLRGQAFGLPLPPRVLNISRQGNHVFVKTDMRLKNLETFYKHNLADYEVILVGSSMRVIPLRDKMPWIRVSRPFGPKFPLHVTYIRADAVAPPSISAQEQESMTPEQKKAALKKRSKPIAKERIPVKGRPVELRTPSGELLAPGAVWGQPYTPPKGSPLDKPRNRYNFGKPFGEWSAD